MTREEELDWLYRLKSEIYVYMPKEWLIPMNNALDMVIKELEQEPCDDAISRQAVLSKKIYTETEEGWSGYTVDADYIEHLPSVRPQEPKTGHCKDCKYFRKLPYHADTLGKCIHHTGFCPKGDWYCADYEPQESEDKCKNCEYYRNPDYTRCHECKAESEDKE